ncbi:26S proteasome non-ATPase regulatory subunit 9 [Cytospora mali]|uniref:Probable 26S proteasome regulatory subunit p27 n=1 Tax=Cytospora mali TaxID=578113 RepID=A0A194UQJ9_CYTMA|nr:26S proteasome non-ATPase regulatory subunit 9 [Valsa mali var. pyri (nom. inval.)]
MGLPLRMNNLHAPTVPSGPTTARAANGSSAHLTFAELQRKKENMEEELKALSSVLDSHGVDMNTSLLTPDGFPRSDLDVAQIRTTRARIIHLRNDYKDLMSKVEKHLHEHFASLMNNDDDVPAAEATTSSSSQEPALRDYVPERLDEPFARVNTVAPSSPADTAGLQPGDLIRNFGYVNGTNHDGLKKVAECVQGNEGRIITVKVSRPGAAPSQRELQLTLVPRSGWGGRGLLGCHVLLLS